MKLKIGKSAIQKNIIAFLFGIVVQLVNQILLVPLYLNYWGVNLYSDWIVLSAISSFFAMSNLGINSVTANQFAMDYSEDKNNLLRCRTLLTNNYLIVIIAAIFASTISLIYISVFNIVDNLGLHEIDRFKASLIFVLLIVKVFMGMYTSVLYAIYRAFSIYHKAVYQVTVCRLLESLIILVCLLLHIDILTMVILFLVPQILVFIYTRIDTYKIFKYNFKYSERNTTLLKSMLKPSLTFMAFPMGNAIVYQGFTLIINKFFGANTVVLFNTTRALCNFIKQILQTVQNSVWPEYSVAYGKQDKERMRYLHRKAFATTTFISIIIGIFLLIFGPNIYELWTNGKIQFSYPLMISFLVVIYADTLWNTSSVCLIATNKHSETGLRYVFMACLSIILAAIIGSFSTSLPLIQYCQLIIHVPLAYYTVKKGLELTGDNLSSFLSALSPINIFNEIKHVIVNKYR